MFSRDAVRFVSNAAAPRFCRSSYPDIRLELTVVESFVDVLAAGCAAVIRYDERLEKDMIAVPIGPRTQRFVAAAAPSYIVEHGAPEHPRDLLSHRCLRVRFDSGVTPIWEFERGGEVVRVDPEATLIVQPGAA